MNLKSRSPDRCTQTHRVKHHTSAPPRIVDNSDRLQPTPARTFTPPPPHSPRPHDRWPIRARNFLPIATFARNFVCNAAGVK